MAASTTTDDVTRRTHGHAGWLRRLVLLAVVGAVAFTAACGSVPGSNKGLEIVAYMQDSAGVFEGNDVGILGVTVGKITEIEPQGNHVAITMQIEPGHKVPANAGAVVVARSVATDRYIELTPVYRGKGKVMAHGAKIPLERTRTPVDFDDVLAALNEFATGISGNKKTTLAVKKFIEAGAAALEGKGPLLNQSVQSLAKATNGVHSQRGNIKATIKSLDVLVAAIAKDEQTARQFINQVTQASKLLASERNNFRKALRSLNRAVTVVADFAIDNRESIVKALDGSTTLMKTILSKRDRLSEILRVLPLALQNIQLAASGGSLNVMIDPLVFFPGGDILTTLCQNPVFALVCDIRGSGT